MSFTDGSNKKSRIYVEKEDKSYNKHRKNFFEMLENEDEDFDENEDW